MDTPYCWFCKQTDRNTSLRADSFHPPTFKKNIPYGQLQRLKRICDQEPDFVTEAKDMQTQFLNRGYKAVLLKTAILKLRK